MSYLKLPKSRKSVRTARHWAAPLLPVDVREAAVLVLSELVTNAVAVGLGARAPDVIEVEITVDTSGQVSVHVTDPSDLALPAPPADVPVDDESGRGLFLLDALADAHGWVRRASGGKCVWALFHSRGALTVEPRPPGDICLECCA
ncbi:ATP-binding protein [Kitasatospora albolonga]